jgi:hypothetical protein
VPESPWKSEKSEHPQQNRRQANQESQIHVCFAGYAATQAVRRRYWGTAIYIWAERRTRDSGNGTDRTLESLDHTTRETSAGYRDKIDQHLAPIPCARWFQRLLEPGATTPIFHHQNLSASPFLIVPFAENRQPTCHRGV